jgi:hypothetical protein
MLRLSAAPALFAVAVACGPGLPGADTDGGSGTDAVTGTDTGSSPNLDSGASAGADSLDSPTPTTEPPDPTVPVTTDGTSGSPDDGTHDSTDSGVKFIVAYDGGIGEPCDIWQQDCPAGEKCTPWAEDGGAAWNSTHCVPIVPDPDPMGAPCTVDGRPTSGIDTCDAEGMCFFLDQDTGVGQCVPFCIGSPEAPLCAERDQYCTISGDGVLNICIPTCDPLNPVVCDESQVCIPVGGGGFVCAPEAEDAAGYGEACEFLNGCAPGLVCMGDEPIPGCEICCSSYCDLALGNPDAQCPDQALGQTCVPWFRSGRAPEGLENVGVCAMR